MDFGVEKWQIFHMTPEVNMKYQFAIKKLLIKFLHLFTIIEPFNKLKRN